VTEFTPITPYGVAIRTAMASGNVDALKVALSLAQELYARDGDVRSAVSAARAHLATARTSKA
jgi:hypothetical protein